MEVVCHTYEVAPKTHPTLGEMYASPIGNSGNQQPEADNAWLKMAVLGRALIKLLEEGKIPFRKVGTRRKVSFRKLMGYKHRDDAERLKIADQLTAEAEEIGLEY